MKRAQISEKSTECTEKVFKNQVGKTSVCANMRCVGVFEYTTQIGICCLLFVVRSLLLLLFDVCCCLLFAVVVAAAAVIGIISYYYHQLTARPASLAANTLLISLWFCMSTSTASALVTQPLQGEAVEKKMNNKGGKQKKERKKERKKKDKIIRKF